MERRRKPGDNADMARQRTRSERTELVNEDRSSGQSAYRFSLERGVAAASLSRWILDDVPSTGAIVNRLGTLIGALAWAELGHLQSREVGEVLERALRRMKRYLRRRGALATDDADESNVAGDESFAATE